MSGRPKTRTTQPTVVTSTTDEELGWTTTGAQWGLYVRTAKYRKNEEGDWSQLSAGPARPLLQSSRNLRIEAVHKFPVLLAKLIPAVQEALAKIEAPEKFGKK
jgi:hypothetical protein